MNNKVTLRPWLGCIADDYTGATDLASFLVASGLKTLQLNTLPNEQTEIDLSQYDAVVVALKSRTCPAEVAIADSLASLAYLQRQGCQKFYFKYCSTFDSTAEGNIGPVTDALMQALNVKSTIVCPALPVNGRTVYNGYLFVKGQLLNESPMNAHPLTPMTDAKLSRLIETQGQGQAVEVDIEQVEKGPEHLSQALAKASEQGQYIIVDALTTADLETISHSLGDFPLITGGSGLAVDLAHEYQQLGGTPKASQTQRQQGEGKTVIFSGSCSTMTQAQVAHYCAEHPALKLDPVTVASGQQSIEQITQWMLEHLDQAPLIYASADSSTLENVHQALGQQQAAELVENSFRQLAVSAKQAGATNIIVAGGETSGAVVQALDITIFEIGESIEPSVPVVTTLDNPPISLALKSGNFGQPDFFSKAKRKLTCF